MYFNNALWYSKTNGHKRAVSMLICLVLLVPSLIAVFIGATKENDTVTIAGIVASGVAIIATAVLLAAGRFTGFKWDVSNLIFAVAESGLYFTGVQNQDSYFSAEWSEIAGYSVTLGKNGFATVTVYFSGVADAGSFGKIRFLKMVNVEGLEKLEKVLRSRGIEKRA